MTSIINCPNCGAGYEIPDLESIQGRKVRCRSCTSVWRVEPPLGISKNPGVAPATIGLNLGGGQPAELNLHREIDKAEAARAGAGDFLASTSGQESQPKTIMLSSQRSAPAPVEQLNGSGSHAKTSSEGQERRSSSAAGASLVQSATDRRRAGRRGSGFDDVEAAIAALQSSFDEPAATSASAGAKASPFARSPAQPAEIPAEAPVRWVNGGTELATRADAGALGEDPFGPDAGFEAELRSSRIAAAIAWVAFLLVLAGLGALAYVERQVVVRALPGTAAAFAAMGAPVNVRGLEFSAVDSQWQVDPRGRPVLSLTGQVKNVSRESQKVPTVVFAFLDADGRELFDWATPVRLTSLAPGETMPFTTVVPAPPEAVRGVEIRFAKALR